MKKCRHAIIATAALALTFLVTGCGTTQWADSAQPPTGWTDLQFAQSTPGNCQDHAYDYCRRLAHRGVSAEVLVVELNNGRMHAIVKCVNNDGNVIYVDPTTADVCYAENYTAGRVISEHLFAKN